jgi:prepilin-type N-terminal cleavage/methylation domain-containing protein
MASPGSSEKTCDEKGFTLIELIVVTALIGIMLSLTIPSLRNTFFTDPLRATTRKAIGLVTGVRELAVRSQQPYLLHISQLESRIWYEREDAGNQNRESDTQKQGDLQFPESVRITGILVESNESSSVDETVVWIGKQGYMTDLILRFEDEDGNHLNVQFYPFLDPALVSDQVAPF